MIWFLIALVVFILMLAYIGWGVYKVLVLDIKRYAKYWTARAAEPVQPNAIRLLAFGDSTFQAIGATKPEYGTVGRIATYLEKQTGRPVHITNLSVSGAKAVDVANEQLPRADFSQADVVVVGVGANDAIKEFDLKVFEESIRTIVAKLPVDKTVMADVALVKHRNAYQDVLAKHRDGAGILGANLAYSFKAVTQSWRLSARDFFHPSNYGYQFWFNAFKPEIDKLISNLNLAK